LKEIYKGPWDPKIIMQEVGGNLRERRARLRRKFKSYKNWKLVPIPLGCSKYSWMKIHKDMFLLKMEKLSASSKAAAEARIDRVGYSHKWGPSRQRGLVKRYVCHPIHVPFSFLFSYSVQIFHADICVPQCSFGIVANVLFRCCSRYLK
jgi:hypothetical protein